MASMVCPVQDGDVVEAKRGAPRWGLGGVLLFGLLFGLVHASLRLAFSENLSGASAFANILAQTLALGYEERQPPLYEWLLWLVQRLTGPSLVSFLLIKYTLLTATFVFLYLAALRLFDDTRWAIVAGLSPLLLYQFGWSVHEGVTHTLALSCAMAASLWAFMRLVERGRLSDYLLFGAVIGLGLISKYGFAAFLTILVACALLQSTLRARLFDVRVLAAFGIAAAITAPFCWWLLAHHYNLVDVFNSTVAPVASDRLSATLRGILNAIYAPIGFLFPLWFILLLMFPSCWREAPKVLQETFGRRDSGNARPDWPLMLLHMTLLGFLFLVLGAVLTGASNYLERYMHPFFLFTPLWLLWFVKRCDSAAQPKSLGLVILAFTLAVVPVRAVNLARALEPDCGSCRLAVQYEGLATTLKSKGFGIGTLMVMDRNDGGNLRRFFPDARVVLLRRPYYAPSVRPQDLEAPAAIIWRPKHGDPLPFQAAPAVWQIGGKVAGKPESVIVPLKVLGDGSKAGDWRWMMALVAPSQGPQL